MSNNYDIEIDLEKPLTESANKYYMLSKKMKKKKEGVLKAIEVTKKKLKNAENIKIVEKEVIAKREKQWFEKYRWSFTRNGLMILAGKDATSNDLIVKRYMDKTDLHFHTNIQGSAHVILKQGQEKADKEDLEDCALIAAIYSKAWKAGLSSIDVYFVNPEQVTKTAQSGEYLGKGAFVIRGKRNWFKKTKLEFSIGVVNTKNYNQDDQELIMIGSEKSLKSAGAKNIINLIPGRKQKSVIANEFIKNIKKKGYNQFKVEDLLHIMPAGKFDTK